MVPNARRFFTYHALHGHSHPCLSQNPTSSYGAWRVSKVRMNRRFGFTIARSREGRKLSVDCRQECDNIAACTNPKAMMAAAAKLARNSYTLRDVGCPTTTNRCGQANSAQPPACEWENNGCPSKMIRPLESQKSMRCLLS